MKIIVNGTQYGFNELELSMDVTTEPGVLVFCMLCGSEIQMKFELCLYSQDEIAYSKYEIRDSQYKSVKFVLGQKELDILEFFSKYEPTIWFIDGSALCGNEYVELKQNYPLYPKEKIVAWKWEDVDISKESQDGLSKIEDSIQFNVIQRLCNQDYDVIYDDDGSGEIADVIAIKEENQALRIELFHLKYAKAGTVSRRIDNLYEICGQAQKSIRWKFREAHEFFDHLLRREQKSVHGQTCSRLEKGNKEMLINFSQIAKRKCPVQFQIFVVQPGMQKSNISDEQLALLSVTESYIKEISEIPVTFIGS